MDFGDLKDNPFAIDVQPASDGRRRAVKSAARFLLLIAVCLTATLILGALGQKWLVHRLMHDFDALDGEAKQARLVQLADVGPAGIEPLVRTLADDDMDVARTAFELLRGLQNDWTVLDRDEITRRHAAMVDALSSVAIRLPDDRTTWGTALLQQTVLDTVQRKDDPSRTLHQDATRAIELLSLSDRAGPSILSDEPLDELTPRRMIVRTEPLPVTSIESGNQWVDWPPPSAATENGEITDPTVPLPPDLSFGGSPTLYRSSAATLKPVDENSPVLLGDVHQQFETVYQADLSKSNSAETHPLQSVSHLIDSPMQTFDDKSVMHWLGSAHGVLREKAKLELIKRGYDSTEITIATQIATADAETKLALIDAIAASNSHDPRPWLLMMLDDDNRRVKLRVVSVLATMNDPTVNRQLQVHLVDERDPTVGIRIRRVLGLPQR